ncbi:MAG: hypothetical protein H6712_09460 [Myxococcales bacterium]|nr:hypothetical protein [Myxococcales bacterium]MCB9714070.1 hypothetical protein [Myxococcales bacterium]
MGSSGLSRVHVFGVRHHSPRSTAMLGALLERVRPQVVLVEGPLDAGPLIDVVVDAKTEPPIAILGYATEGEPRSALWPFAAYSPEYRALRWAAEHGAQARFIDVPVGVSLARDAIEEHGPDEAREDDEPGAEADAPRALDHDPHQRAAEARGLRSFEELWEACFEAPNYTPEQFREAMLAHAALTREAHPVPWHQARDVFMAARIEDVIAEGVEPERIVAVVGAAHAVAFVTGDLDPARLALLPEPRPSAVTVIPFSYPRLAAQLGYGAGNRAPQYYQLAHEAGCDFRHATLRALLGFGDELRSRGFAASMADTIEAYRLACALAELRDKAHPGLDELREACIATMCRGDAQPVDAFLWKGVLGHRVGKVAERIGKNSLQEEFWREVNARDLPREDQATEIALQLREPVAIQTSVFLHRLRVAGVPYATFQGSYSSSAMRTRGNQDASEAGDLSALQRMREAWEAQWTPSTDVALVERIALGNTLEQITSHVLGERLGAASSTGEAASVLMEAVVTDCSRPAADAMRACDQLAATDDDLPSLARACQALAGLVTYGSSRSASPDRSSEATLRALCTKTFDRAVLRVRPACLGDEDAVAQVPLALQTLHEVALAPQAFVDREAWLRAARELVEDYAIHPSTAGVATALLYLARVIEEDEVATFVSQRLSDTLHPLAGAAYLEGFLRVNSTVLVRNRSVVETLDAFVSAVEADAFRNILPLLRRSFGSLGSTERRYFLENLIHARNLGDQARAAAVVITTQDEATLAEIGEDLDDALGDLDDLL